MPTPYNNVSTWQKYLNKKKPKKLVFQKWVSTGQQLEGVRQAARGTVVRLAEAQAQRQLVLPFPVHRAGFS
jgi:hypothetical protein